MYRSWCHVILLDCGENIITVNAIITIFENAASDKKVKYTHDIVASRDISPAGPLMVAASEKESAGNQS